MQDRLDVRGFPQCVLAGERSKKRTTDEHGESPEILTQTDHPTQLYKEIKHSA